ncbi:MAG: HEPN domain protein [Candidatus Bathyarchaeota archaeon BA1]|nr:MAG: HEPN domain protein [Candidatus Bathyarchaeota archaeon BA1]
MLKRAEVHGLKADDFVEKAKGLSDQYMAPRYPNFREERGIKLEDYTEDFAKQCLRTAKMIWERALEHIKNMILE